MSRIPIFKARIPKLTGRSVPMPPKQRADYYSTPEHQVWAKQVKALAGYQCQKCGRSGVTMYADHIKEIKDGGTWALSNGQCLCGSCHTIKTMIERAKRAFADPSKEQQP